MTVKPKPCRFAGLDQRRAVRDEHVRDCVASGCPGCKPCPASHCASCGHRHLGPGERLTCATCVGTVREDLTTIGRLCGGLLAEAVHRGVDSEAAMLAGPAADVADWQRRQRLIVNAALRADDERSAEHRRLVAWLEDSRDEMHPLWVLGIWEMLWREHLEHETDEPVTITVAADYLGRQLTYMAQQHEPDFDQFATEVRDCRGHLEDVLRDGVRDETGAPCPMCGAKALVRDAGPTQATPCGCGPRPRMRHGEHGRCDCPIGIRLEVALTPAGETTIVPIRVSEDPLPEDHVHPRSDLSCIACHRERQWDTAHAAHGGAAAREDRWACPSCSASYNEHDYRTKVDAVYVLHAEALPASQIREVYRVPEGTVRQWANRGHVRKHGRDLSGRQLYDVGDTLRMRDRDDLGTGTG